MMRRTVIRLALDSKGNRLITPSSTAGRLELRRFSASRIGELTMKGVSTP